jgi:hypothetical protein
MRPELMTPEGALDRGMLRDVLLLVSVTVDEASMEPWTDLELALAYDWAMREHLAASDNPVKRRPKPLFVEAAEKAEADRLRTSTLGQGPYMENWTRWIGTLEGSQQPISQDLAIAIGAAQAAIDELLRAVPDREQIATLNAADTGRLRAWLAKPNGSFITGRATLESVAGGGVMVRVRPYEAGSG